MSIALENAVRELTDRVKELERQVAAFAAELDDLKGAVIGPAKPEKRSARG